MTFLEAKQERNRLDAIVTATGKELKRVSGTEKSPMGLTPDHIRATPEWQQARRAFDAAFKALQSFNRGYVKQFKKEIMQDRKERRGY